MIEKKEKAVRTSIDPDGIHPPQGYSHIAIASAPRLAFIAGQVALTSDFILIGEGDLAAQTRAAMGNLGTALAELGVGWDAVVRRTIYTLHPDSARCHRRRDRGCSGQRPAPGADHRGVDLAAVDGLLIEIEATVALDEIGV